MMFIIMVVVLVRRLERSLLVVVGCVVENAIWKDDEMGKETGMRYVVGS